MNHITTAVKETKRSFEVIYLDGDEIQDGQMLASSECMNAILSATIKILESVVEESSTPISKIIDWWENKLTPDDRSQMMKESWKGDVNNRHAELRIMYLSYAIFSAIDSIKKELV